MARKTKEEAAATRKSVLMATLDIFSAKGYSHTTFSDIAKRIGMTRGAVYWHFDNKPALLVALIDYFYLCETDQARQNFAGIYSLNELKEAFIRHARAVIEDKNLRKFEFFMTYQMEWSEELLTETHKTLDRIRKRPFDQLVVALSQPAIADHFTVGVDPVQLGVTLIGLWAGLLKIYLGACPKIDLVASVADGFDCVVRGAVTNGGGL